MNTSTQEFKHPEFTAQYEKKPGCNVELSLTIHPTLAKSTHRRALKNISKEISIPGFRKGKAPDALLMKQFGPQIESEWQEILFKEAFEQFATKTELHPISKQINLKSAKLSLEQDCAFSVSYEAYPSIPSIDTKQLSIPAREEKSFSEEDIQAKLEDFRAIHQSWDPVENRPVQEKDYIEVSIEDACCHSGTIIAKTRLYKVEEKDITNWMMKLVLGQELNATVEAPVDFSNEPESYNKSNPREDKESLLHEGHSYKITIKKILVLNRPEINDELAQKFDLPNTEALKEKAKTDLRQEMIQEQDHKAAHALLEQAAEVFSFEVPASVLNAVCKDAFQQELDQAQQENKEISDEEKKELQAKVEKDSLKEIRIHYLTQKFADEHHLQVNQEDLKQELTHHLLYSGLLQHQNHPQFDSILRNMRTRISQDMLKELVAQKLLEMTQS